METNSIVVKLNGQNSVTLTSNTPEIKNLIEKIIENRSNINVEDIIVECPEGSNFDAEGFKIVLVNTIGKYLKSVEINETNLKTCLEKLQIN